MANIAGLVLSPIVTCTVTLDRSAPSAKERPAGSETEAASFHSPSRKSVPPPSATAIVPLKSDATESVPPSRTRLPSVTPVGNAEGERVPERIVNLPTEPLEAESIVASSPAYTRLFTTTASSTISSLPASVVSPASVVCPYTFRNPLTVISEFTTIRLPLAEPPLNQLSLLPLATASIFATDMLQVS